MPTTAIIVQRFNRFVQSLDSYRNRVEAQYNNATYPASFGGGHFTPAVGSVNKYSADVMVPAFLNAYTSMSGNGLNIFPSLRSLLPNWSILTVVFHACHSLNSSSRVLTSIMLTAVFLLSVLIRVIVHGRNT